MRRSSVASTSRTARRLSSRVTTRRWRASSSDTQRRPATTARWSAISPRETDAAIGRSSRPTTPATAAAPAGATGITTRAVASSGTSIAYQSGTESRARAALQRVTTTVNSRIVSGKATNT